MTKQDLQKNIASQPSPLTPLPEGEGNSADFSLPKNWKKTTLGEVCERIGDGLHGTPEYSLDGEYYFINGNNIKNGKIIIKLDTKRVNQKEFFKYKKDLGVKTILLSINGTIGNLAKYNNEKCILGKSAAYLNIKNDVILDFIYYLMLDNKFQHNISKNANGSTIKNVSLAQLRNYKFLLPPLQQQKAIAGMLGVFDDKIELLREQNETLEKIGETIFKEYFSLKNPHPNPLPKGEEALPDGWRVGKIGDLVNIFSGFAFKSKNFTDDGKYKLVTIRNVQDGNFVMETKDRLNLIPEKMPEYCHLKTGDILLSLTGNVGRVCHVVGKNYFLNQRVAKLEAKNKNDFSFVYLLFRQKSFLSILENLSSGTAQQNLSPIKTGELDIVIPNRKKLDEFASLANPNIEKILSNLEQIQTLSQTRDTLLPKLMKGEIILSEK